MTAWTVHIEVMVTEKLSAVEWELHKQSCISLGGKNIYIQKLGQKAAFTHNIATFPCTTRVREGMQGCVIEVEHLH